MSRTVLNKRSNVVLGDGSPKIPTPDQLKYGEIAINYNAGKETISFKNSNNEVVAFGDEVVIGSSEPLPGSHAEIFIDESIDPVGVEIYTKSEVDDKFLTKSVASSTYITNETLSDYATTASVLQATSDATFNNGHNAVSSVTGIPVSKRLVIATISNNGSFTLASTPADGREIHVIVHNTSSSDIEITMPSGSNYVKMSGDTLTVAGSSYADINVISDGTKMYIRAL